MSSTALDCDAASSSLSIEDWVSCFDFSDLPRWPSTQEDDDLALLLDFDTSDLLLPQVQTLPPLNLCDVLPSSISEPPQVQTCDVLPPSILEPDQDGDGEFLSSILEFDGCPYHQISSEATPLATSEHLNTGVQEAVDASFTISSPHVSDAGSSFAARDGASFNKEDNTRSLSSHQSSLKDGVNRAASSSHKRPHEDTGSDLDGGDEEGRSRLNRLDKRQQRLLRNRELAFESRQRKKCYISELEAKCRVLEQERNQFQQKLCFASAENAVLKKELSRVKDKKGKDGVTEPAVLFKNSLPLEFLLLLICLLLMALLSLCVSPFLALVLQTSLFPQSATKVRGGLIEKQIVVSERRFMFVINSRIWLPFNLWRHPP